MTTKHMTAVLITVLALAAATVAAAGGNHWTVGTTLLDDYGYQGRAAEDWSMAEETSFFGLFAWDGRDDLGKGLALNGAGTNASGGFSGLFALSGGTPGQVSYGATYRTFDRFYDGSSEMAYPMPEPAYLEVLPELRWARGNAAVRYRMSETLTFRVNVDEMRRSGDKGSLARSGGGLAVPGVKEFDTKSMRATVAADWRVGSLRGDLGLTIGKDEGDRALRDDHAYVDDVEHTTVSGGAAWDATGDLSLLGRFAMTTTTSKPVENVSADTAADMERKARSGALAALWRPARGLSAKVSAAVRKVETDGTTEDAQLAAFDRERESTDLRADVTWRGPDRTSLRVLARHRTTTLLENLFTAAGGDPDHVTDQERTSTTLRVKARRALSPKASLVADFETGTTDIVQQETGDMRYWQGDRERSGWTGSAAASLRPARGVRLDVGGRAIRRTFTRTDIEGLETTFDADRFYASGSWLATERVTVIGSVSWGHEVHGVPEGAEAADGQAATTYDATTLLSAPGLSWDLGGGWRCECHWEAVRKTDSVENDYDRGHLRTSYDLNDRMTVAGCFRKYEFDENRWDDYILDLYTLSITSRF